MIGAQEEADVLVVGAGPAGAATSLLLARSGFRVLLLDRAAFPRAKACGDCLSAGATGLLQRLGVLDAVGSLPAARLQGWRITAPDGTAFTARFASHNSALPAEAIAIERRLLDSALLDAAIREGVRFLPGVRVTDLLYDDGRVAGVSAAQQQYRARLTIGADGLRSVLANRLRAVRRPVRLRKLSLSLHLETDALTEDIGEMHLGPGLCVGLAPVTADRRRCNLTIVADAARRGRSVAHDRVAFITAAVSAMPALRDRLRTRPADLQDVLASGPFDRPVRRITFDGAALVGDAAGYYDPFTGQGIFQALASAESLASVAAAALAAGDVSAAALRPYAVARARLVRGPRAVQWIIEHVLERPTVASLAIRRIAAAGTFAQTLIRVTGDVAPVSQLLTPRVLYSLVSPAPEDAQ